MYVFSCFPFLHSWAISQFNWNIASILWHMNPPDSCIVFSLFLLWMLLFIHVPYSKARDYSNTFPIHVKFKYIYWTFGILCEMCWNVCGSFTSRLKWHCKSNNRLLLLRYKLHNFLFAGFLLATCYSTHENNVGKKIPESSMYANIQRESQQRK